MSDKTTATKEFISSLAKDDYIQADKCFEKVVKNAIENIINNRKPEILKRLSAQAEQIAKESVGNVEKKE